ncbi:MAG: hypothetical protein KDB27_06295, partial [Planctomycetales bacterium]|nr:hypothetical protein [Planctomycetales bacterium]
MALFNLLFFGRTKSIRKRKGIGVRERNFEALEHRQMLTGDLLVVSWEGDSVLRFSGANGDFVGEFINAATGTLDQPTYSILGPDGHLYV